MFFVFVLRCFVRTPKLIARRMHDANEVEAIQAIDASFYATAVHATS